MRFRAYLDTAPEGQSVTRAEGYHGPMPDTGKLFYIIRWLFEAGPMSFTPMGQAPLDWQAIKAWQDLQGLELEPQEVDALRHLSTAYLSQQQKSEDKACPPPWVDTEQLDRDKVADKVSSTFKAIAQRKKDKGSGRRSTTTNRS